MTRRPVRAWGVLSRPRIRTRKNATAVATICDACSQYDQYESNRDRGSTIADVAAVLVRLPFVALSGEEAVGALRRVGFRVRTEGASAILTRGARRVVVPAEQILDAETVRRILREAGIDYVALLDQLSTPPPIANDERDGDR